MSVTPSQKAFYTHLIVYVALNAILLAINATQTPAEGEPREWWSLWPLTGWGIGIATHGFAEWTQSKSSTGQFLANPDMRGLTVHLFLYLSVNAFLIAINLTGSSESLWFIWPLLGWGLGLATHAWLAYNATAHRKAERAAKKSTIARPRKTPETISSKKRDAAKSRSK